MTDAIDLMLMMGGCLLTCPFPCHHHQEDMLLAKKVRDMFKDYFFNEAAVEWQIRAKGHFTIFHRGDQDKDK